MKANSQGAVLAALAGNVAIAAIKFMVAGISGSAAMWAEGIHSLVDTGNQALMLIGMRRSKQPPDVRHPFGHGKELYFWNLMVAVLIFGVGGGISAYEGLLRMISPRPVEQTFWNYVVLSAAFLIEGASFTVAFRAFTAQHGAADILGDIVASKDPTTYTVLAEDGAALVGLLIAAGGIFLSHALRFPSLDGLASILIGLLLATVASFLIRECRGLLVGEGVDAATEREIRKMVSEDPLVESVRRPLTMYLGPNNALLTLDVQFRSSASVSDVARSIDRLKFAIRNTFPDLKRIYVEAETASVPTADAQGAKPRKHQLAARKRSRA